jgi:hypothetical protein
MTTYNNTYPNPTANALSSFTKIRTQPKEDAKVNKGMMARKQYIDKSPNNKKQPALVAHEIFSYIRNKRMEYKKGDVDATV